MFIVRILFNIKSDQVAEFKQVAQEVVALGRQMTGCRYYEIFAAQSTPNAYLLYEEWDTKENFYAFKASATFKEIGDKLTPSLDGAPSSIYFSADIVEQH